VFYAIVSQGNQQHTDCLDVAGAGAGWLLNVAVKLPLPNRDTDDATKTPDLVTAKIRDKIFVTVLRYLIEWLPKSTDPAQTWTVKRDTNLMWVSRALTGYGWARAHELDIITIRGEMNPIGS